VLAGGDMDMTRRRQLRRHATVVISDGCCRRLRRARTLCSQHIVWRLAIAENSLALSPPRLRITQQHNAHRGIMARIATAGGE